MPLYEQALLLLLLTTCFSIVARWLPWPAPITYVLGGVAFAFVPHFPGIRLSPTFFFPCFLPPLLFSDGWLMPLREFAKARRAIFMMATGLVILTTVVVGLVAHAVVPGLPLAMGFALGAVVSPTDAVATSAILEKLAVPTRLNTILSGESLMNDATGLVAFRFALAAVAAGTFSLQKAAATFVGIAAGGLALGLAIAWVVGKIRDLLIRYRSADPLIEITVSLMTPYAAFLAAEQLHLSGVLAVVAAGLYSGWRDPVRMDAETRQTTWTVWSTILFWLNGLAFVLLGLQFPRLLAAVSDDYGIPQLIKFVAFVSGAVILIRIAWIFPGAYAPFWLSAHVRRTETRPSWRAVLVGGWAGMRGTVTLAAALSIPLVARAGVPFPGRDIVIFLSFGVIAVTLLLQGTTLEWLIRRLDLRGDGMLEKEEWLARTTAVRAGLDTLRTISGGTLEQHDREALGYIIAEYEVRLSELAAEGPEQSSAVRRRAADKRYRFAALEAERRAVDQLWQSDRIADEVHRELQSLLDHEEGMLRRS
ncbi:MAG TPA: Na+/H+ antiporter [Opitutaceae bacterium]|jgi:CPA1 family monovalent cation:H+ antiporter